MPDGTSSSLTLSLGVTHGTNRDTGAPVFQFNTDRFRHTVIVGRTGSGKSNHLQQMEREDIRDGAGCLILAAHEEDALYPLACVPDERLDDVILIDASNQDYLPCMNPLDVDVRDQRAVDRAISDVIELVSTENNAAWLGPRARMYFNMTLGLILHPNYPGPRDLSQMEVLLTNPNFTRKALRACDDERLSALWQQEVDACGSSGHNDAVQWMLSKVNDITSDRTLRHFFCGRRSTIDMDEVLRDGKILVAAVLEEQIGATAARLINTWLALSLRRAILRRGQAAGVCSGLDYRRFERAAGREDPAVAGLEPLFVYVDEFARFASKEFSRLLAEARKFNVGLILSFQTLSQTRAYDLETDTMSDLADAVLGNVGTVVSYPVGGREVGTLCDWTGAQPSDLLDMEAHQPVARLCEGGHPGDPLVLKVGLKPAPDNPTAPWRIAKRQVHRGVWVPYEDGLTGLGLDGARCAGRARGGLVGKGCAWRLDALGVLTIGPAEKGRPAELGVSSAASYAEAFEGGKPWSWPWLELAERVERVVFLDGVKGGASLAGLFRGCRNLVSMDVSGIDVEVVENMSGMFRGCASLTEVDLSCWHAPRLRDVRWMFSGCSALRSLRWEGQRGCGAVRTDGMVDGCAALGRRGAVGGQAAA